MFVETSEELVKNEESQEKLGGNVISNDDEMEIDAEATNKPVKAETFKAVNRPQVNKVHETAAQASLQGKATNKKKKFVRTAAGRIWEDATLAEWDPSNRFLFLSYQKELEKTLGVIRYRFLRNNGLFQTFN